MCSFLSCILVGFPVEPEVCTVIKSVASNQHFKKENISSEIVFEKTNNSSKLSNDLPLRIQFLWNLSIYI
jgi:hypothetical protein